MVSATPMAYGIFERVGNRNTREKKQQKYKATKKTKDKMAVISLHISVIILNFRRIKFTNQKTGWLDGLKNKIPLYGAPKKLSSRDKCRLNVKEWHTPSKWQPK